MFKILAVLFVAGLAACGMKGPLQLPPGSPPAPLLGNVTPSAPSTEKEAAASPAKDVNTDKNPGSR